jgi:hypothetical protein
MTFLHLDLSKSWWNQRQFEGSQYDSSNPCDTTHRSTGNDISISNNKDYSQWFEECNKFLRSFVKFRVWTISLRFHVDQ